MNISTVDLSEISDIELEDEVVIISVKNNDKNSVQNIAKIIGVIPYEVLIAIPTHLRREVV